MAEVFDSNLNRITFCHRDVLQHQGGRMMYYTITTSRVKAEKIVLLSSVLPSYFPTQLFVSLWYIILSRSITPPVGMTTNSAIGPAIGATDPADSAARARAELGFSSLPPVQHRPLHTHIGHIPQRELCICCTIPMRRV